MRQLNSFWFRNSRHNLNFFDLVRIPGDRQRYLIKTLGNLVMCAQLEISRIRRRIGVSQYLDRKMSEAASNLVDAFSLLSLPERRDVLIELVRISEVDAGDLTDDELAVAGEQVFSMYDAEEAERGETSSR